MGKAEKYSKCTYPGCMGNVIPNRSQMDLCAKHTEQIQFLLWALDKVMVKKEEQTKSGLIIPKQ